MKTIPCAASVLLACLSICPPTGIAAGSSLVGELIASPEPGWPQWRGPRRDGVSDEKGLLDEWPKEGPKLLWKATGIGRGYSSPIITGGKLYITGDISNSLVIAALDLQGRELWRATNGAAWKGSYPGARATCVVRDGRLFNLNAHGIVGAFDAATGRPLWSVNVLERFGGKNITWAMSECLLVDGARVVVTAGGEKALVAALDAASGDTVWASAPLRPGLIGPSIETVSGDPATADGPGYAAPILFRLGGRRHIAGISNRHAYGVDADTGKLLWARPLPTKYKVLAATPVLWRDSVFATGPDGEGGKLFRLIPAGDGIHVETAWISTLDTCQAGVVVVGDRLYGPHYRDRKRWVCVDLPTGRTLYEMTDLTFGPSIFADGCLYALSQDGEAVLLKPGDTGFEIKGRFRLVSGVSDLWAHPVILEGRLYLRYHDTLHVYDIKKGTP